MVGLETCSVFNFSDYKEITVISTERYSKKCVCNYQHPAKVLKSHIYQFYIKEDEKKITDASHSD